jgi:hypothetical protein
MGMDIMYGSSAASILILILCCATMTKQRIEHKYRTIFDYDPNKQELIELCCPRKPDPKSPMQHLPPVTAF